MRTLLGLAAFAMLAQQGPFAPQFIPFEKAVECIWVRYAADPIPKCVPLAALPLLSGPVGPVGPVGPAGAPGPKGDTGSAGPAITGDTCADNTTSAVTLTVPLKDGTCLPVVSRGGSKPMAEAQLDGNGIYYAPSGARQMGVVVP